ncbi:anti-sigma factor family protein [Aeromicrobium ginsengisoli]|uniref:Anti-sigma factor n=1 Tax=Aeromicrobium ginsengisoli TaxID=363867 RepID=A0A5M4FDD5_9ACTN|nr:zf-HC2 domain-containing protein [Aeromicrobium ginsengisoli]KAA1397354.1 anti-sigma factor [Aeromicrobium ginsengisoli]
MSRTHDELRESLGAYVLGQLDDADLLRDVEQHLAACAECRAEVAEIGPLAAALKQIDLDDIRPVGVVPPPELDERIRRTLPQPVHGLRRWAPAVGGVLVGAAAATIVVVALPEHDPPAPTIITVPKVESVDGVTASAGLVDHTWGVEIKLTTKGLPAGERFEMWVEGDDGKAYDAGEFIGVKGKVITCDMSASVLLADAKRFKVVDARGTEVIAADLPS